MTAVDLADLEAPKASKKPKDSDTADTSSSRRPSAVAARALGITQGQAATMFIAIGVAAVLTLGGLPPVLRNRGDGSTAAPIGTSAPPAIEQPVTSGDGAVAAPTPEAPAFSDPGAVAPSFSDGSGSAAPTFADDPPASSPSESSFGGSAPSSPSSPPSSGRVPPATGEAQVFAPVASSGAPDGIAVGRQGRVFVAGGSEILTFDPTGAPGRRFPVRGEGVALTGLAVHPEVGLVALDGASGRVLRIDTASGRESLYAELLDLPACGLVVAAVNGCEPGVQDDKPLPRAAAFDGAGTLFVADASQGAIWRIPRGGKPQLFSSDATFGSGDGLTGLALAADGAVLVSAPRALDPEAAGGGAVYRIARAANGAAGERTLVARFLPNERPAGLTALRDGSIVVALQEAGAVVLLDAEGAEVRRVEGPAGNTPIEGPTGVAFQGDTLLVTNAAADKANWAVLAVGIR